MDQREQQETSKTPCTAQVTITTLSVGGNVYQCQRPDGHAGSHSSVGGGVTWDTPPKSGRPFDGRTYGVGTDVRFATASDPFPGHWVNETRDAAILREMATIANQSEVLGSALIRLTRKLRQELNDADEARCC